jgi:adenylate cyclase
MLGESGALSVLEDLQRQWVRIAFGLAILCFFAVHAAKWHQWPFINRLENIAYDARLLVTMPKTVDERIVIVDIDEKSLAAEGRWPWSRDKVAAMVDGLFERYKAGLVGFDVVFAEPEEATGLAVIEQLASTELAANPVFAGEVERLRPKLDHDRILAQSLSGRPIILGYFFTDADQTGHIPTVGKLPEPLFRSGSFAGRSIPFVSAPGYSANLAVLQDNATHAGHLISLPDGDGVVRRVPMLYEHAGQYYESLSLAVVRAALGIDAVQAGFPVDSRAGRGYSGMEWLQVGDRRVPVDSQIRSLVPFRGRQGGFPYVSATDVIRGTADPAMLDGRIVLVGTTAKGLLDLRATPVQADFPGVEVHANLVAGILDGVVKDNPGYTLGAEFVLVLATGLVMAVALPLLSPLWSAACTAVLLAGVIGVNLLIWQQGNWVFPLASGVLVILTLFLFNMSYGFFVESRGKRQLAGLFGEYVPPELVEEMSRHPDSISLESESRELTVLFSDVRSFTTISEGLDPQELSDLMNEFLTPLTRIIYNHRGTIDKYMGDAIMAFWGAPLADAEHARHGLEAAMTMIAEMRRLQPAFQARGWPALRIGVGLNSGPMSVGNMGSEYRRAYTVLGDAVNLGSRLEGLTKEYGVDVIVNETTRAAVPEYAYRELDRVRVKGKDRPVTIYEPLGPREQLDEARRGELGLYREALKLYRSQNWDMAEIQFLNLHKAGRNGVLYAMYAERIAHFRERPPGAGWDGVFTHLTK